MLKKFVILFLCVALAVSTTVYASDITLTPKKLSDSSFLDFNTEEGFTQDNPLQLSSTNIAKEWHIYAAAGKTAGLTGDILVNPQEIPPDASAGAMQLTKSDVTTDTSNGYAVYRSDKAATTSTGLVFFSTRLYFVNDETYNGTRQFTINLHGGSTAFNIIMTPNADRTKSTVNNITLGNEGFTYNEWVDVNASINLTDRTYTLYINGIQAGKKNTAFSGNGIKIQNVRFNYAAAVTDAQVFVDYCGYQIYDYQEAVNEAASIANYTQTEIPNDQLNANIKMNVNVNGVFDIPIVWECDRSDIINTVTGAVTPSTEDVTVKFKPTAVFNIPVINGEPSTITYTANGDEISVLVRGLSLQEALERDLENISFDEIKGDNTDIDHVDSDLNLWDGRNTVLGYSDVSWTSDKPTIITPGGEVNCVATQNTVTLTAHFVFEGTHQGMTADKVFVITVMADTDDTSAVAAAEAALTLGNISAVKNDITLPLKGKKNTAITWNSNKPEVIDVESTAGFGKVTRESADDQVVILTATIVRGDESMTKTFTVTVKGFVPMTINNIRMEDSNGSQVFKPVDSGRLTDLSFTRYTPDENLTGEEVITVAVYENSVLRGVKMINIKDTNSEFETENTVSDIDLPLSENSEIKVMAINDTQSIQPLILPYQPLTEINDKVKLFFVGDSSASICVHTGPNNRFPQAGWAQMWQNYFPESEVEVVDLALSGRSSKSFLREPNYTKLKNELSEGDFLVMQWGGNDAKSGDPDRYTDPAAEIDGENSYKGYLLNYYINLALERGAHPILLTSCSRRKLSNPDLERHAQATREMAAKTNLPLIDMYAIMNSWLSTVGDTVAGNMYINIKPHDSRFAWNPEFEQSQYYDKGIIDNSHFNMYGADLVAQFATEELKRIHHPLGDKATDYKALYPLPSYVDAVSLAPGETAPPAPSGVPGVTPPPYQPVPLPTSTAVVSPTTTPAATIIPTLTPEPTKIPTPTTVPTSQPTTAPSEKPTATAQPTATPEPTATTIPASTATSIPTSTPITESTPTPVITASPINAIVVPANDLTLGGGAVKSDNSNKSYTWLENATTEMKTVFGNPIAAANTSNIINMSDVGRNVSKIISIPSESNYKLMIMSIEYKDRYFTAKVDGGAGINPENNNPGKIATDNAGGSNVDLTITQYDLGVLASGDHTITVTSAVNNSRSILAIAVIASETPEPTATLKPTSEPKPTATIEPTLTPEPTATIPPTIPPTATPPTTAKRNLSGTSDENITSIRLLPTNGDTIDGTVNADKKSFSFNSVTDGVYTLDVAYEDTVYKTISDANSSIINIDVTEKGANPSLVTIVAASGGTPIDVIKEKTVTININTDADDIAISSEYKDKFWLIDPLTGIGSVPNVDKAGEITQDGLYYKWSSTSNNILQTGSVKNYVFDNVKYTISNRRRTGPYSGAGAAGTNFYRFTLPAAAKVTQFNSDVNAKGRFARLVTEENLGSTDSTDWLLNLGEGKYTDSVELQAGTYCIFGNSNYEFAGLLVQFIRN